MSEPGSESQNPGSHHAEPGFSWGVYIAPPIRYAPQNHRGGDMAEVKRKKISWATKKRKSKSRKRKTKWVIVHHGDKKR